MSEEKVTKDPYNWKEGNEIGEHESYGMLHFDRITGTIGPLFGTPVETGGAIRFILTEGKRDFDRICGESFREGKIIAEGMMSSVQFAEVITTMNCGEGVPVTLTTVREDTKLKNCEKPPPQQTEAKRLRVAFQEEVAERQATMTAVKRRIDKLLHEAKISKVRRKEISNEIFQFFRLFDDSAPFVMDRIDESVIATVSKAKTEIHAFAEIVAARTGIEAIKSGISVPQLEEGLADDVP